MGVGVGVWCGWKMASPKSLWPALLFIFPFSFILRSRERETERDYKKREMESLIILK